MINTKFEVQFPALVSAIWTFLGDASADVDGHFATFIPSFGFFDRIELHMVHDLVGIRAIDTLNGQEQFAVLAP